MSSPTHPRTPEEYAASEEARAYRKSRAQVNNPQTNPDRDSEYMRASAQRAKFIHAQQRDGEKYYEAKRRLAQEGRLPSLPNWRKATGRPAKPQTPESPKPRPSDEAKQRFAAVSQGLSIEGMRGNSTRRKSSRKNEGPRIFKSKPDFILLCESNGWRCQSCERSYGDWYGTETNAERVSPVQMHAFKPVADGGTHEDVLNGCNFCNRNQNVQKGFASREAMTAEATRYWGRLAARGVRRVTKPQFMEE